MTFAFRHSHGGTYCDKFPNREDTGLAMESGVVGFLAIALLLLAILWLIFSLSKGLWRILFGSKHDDTSPDISHLKSDRIRFPPLVAHAPTDPSEFDYRLVPFTTDNPTGYGYVVESVEDGQRLAWDYLSNRAQGMESFGVAGETHHREDLQADSFRPPARLSLMPEPTNPYDPNAVAVWDAAKRYQAGYIPGSEAKRIGGRIRKGQIVECLSIWETIVNGKRVSLRMLLVSQKARLQRPIIS